MKKLLTLILLLPTMVFAGFKTIELNSRNTINFNQAFTSQYVAQKQLESILLCATNLGQEINLVLYTPGGSVSAGQRFFDTLKALPCTFNTITIFSASMGYQTVQQLGKRYILPSGILMSHRASVNGLRGEVFGELDSILNLIKSNVDELDVVASERVGISLYDYRLQIRDELWLTGEQAVVSNHADEVVLVRCDKSLMGTSSQKVNTIFGSFEAEFSDCPIIIGPVSIGGNKSLDISESEIFEYLTNIRNHVFTEL